MTFNHDGSPTKIPSFTISRDDNRFVLIFDEPITMDNADVLHAIDDFLNAAVGENYVEWMNDNECFVHTMPRR